MPKQVIVVVHGVGVREAGVATDLVSLALNEPPTVTPAGEAQADGAPANPWRPHSSDDFLLQELPAYTENDRVRPFGARLRRSRRYGGADGSTITDERVIADFYWGDISGTGTSTLQVIFGLFRVIFGLSHVVRENLQSVFPGATRGDPWLRWIGAQAVLLVHGPIFALNIVLLSGFGIAVGLPWVFHDAESGMAAVWLTGVIAILGGAWLLWRVVRVYLLRFLVSWIIVTGVMVWALAAYAQWLGCFSATPDGLCGMVLGADHDRIPYRAIGGRLLDLTNIAWGLSLVAALVVGGACLFRRGDLAARGAVQIVLPTVGLMTLLLAVVAGTIWAAALQSTQASAENKLAVAGALAPLPTTILFLALIAFFGALRHIRQTPELSAIANPQDYLAAADVLAERHRLIAAEVVRRLLSVFVLLVLAEGAWRVFTGTNVSATFQAAKTVAGWFAWPMPDLADVMPFLLSALLLLGGLAIGFLRGGLSQGIAILTDVIAHLNNHSWQGEDGVGQPTFLERLTGTSEAQLARAAPVAGYWLRRRIRDRMKVLVADLIRTERPDEIMIISHSQGTVIAMDVVAHSGLAWKAALDLPCTLRLITMGSPYSHLYHSYFPLSFLSHRLRPGLFPVASGDGLASLDQWVNIFRLDDFIGTHIDLDRNRPPGMAATDRWPTEVPVPVGGHTNYWLDPEVIIRLRDIV